MTKIKLYSCLICPFAQRSWLYALHYKIDFEYCEFDLYDENFKKITVKPDWFMKLNPNGTVPVLTVGEESIYESSVINDYIENFLNTDEKLVLTPKDGFKRAHTKIWKIFFDEKIMSLFYRILQAPDPTEIVAQLYKNIRTFMDLGYSRYGGDFFGGDEYGEMEYHAVPFMIRYKIVLPLLKEINIFENKAIEDFTKYSERCYKNEYFLQTSYKHKPSEHSTGVMGFMKNHNDKYDYEKYLSDSYLLYAAKK